MIVLMTISIVVLGEGWFVTFFPWNVYKMTLEVIRAFFFIIGRKMSTPLVPNSNLFNGLSFSDHPFVSLVAIL